MACIFLDTVSPTLKVAIQSESGIFSRMGGSQSGSKTLFRFIQELLAESNLSILEIESIYYNRGPGSFTGIKVGHVFSQGFGIFSPILVGSFTTFDLMEMEAQYPSDATYLLYAYQNEYFLARRQNGTWCFQVISVSELKSEDRPFYLGSERYQLEYFQPLKGIEAEKLPRLKERGQLTELISPLYLKKSTAEMKLKRMEE